jgi:uncharacterized protein
MNQQEKNIAHLIKQRIKKKNPSADIILYGSHARGQSHNNSDWDILILLNQSNVSRLIEKEYRDELYEIELEIGEAISTFVFSKNDWEMKYKVTPLYLNIKKDGIHL